MRRLLPSRTVALHERLNETNLPDLCQVEMPALSEDGATWIAWEDLLPCRVSPLGTAVERVQASQVQGEARYLVVFAKATDIPLAARLSITIGTETLLLDPHGSNGPRSYETQRKYECSLWEGPAAIGEDEEIPEQDL